MAAPTNRLLSRRSMASNASRILRSPSCATGVAETQRIFTFADSGTTIRVSTGRNPDKSRSRRPSEDDAESVRADDLMIRRPIDRFALVFRIVFMSDAFSNLATALTVYALFGDDVRVAFTPFGELRHSAVDDFFDVCTMTCLFIFTAELIAFCCFRYNYFLHFFFWLDLIATASLVTDITSVNEYMQGYGSDSEDSAMTRAGRAGRVGTKAARFMRIIRLVRLIRVVKLYRSITFPFSKKKNQEEVEPEILWDEDPDESIMKQSRVSKKLSDLTGKRVIMIVLGMLFCTPIFDYKTWNSDSTSAQYGADWIHDLYRTNKLDAADAMAHYIQYHAPRAEKSWNHWAGAANIFYVGFSQPANPWLDVKDTNESTWIAFSPPFEDVQFSKGEIFDAWRPTDCSRNYGFYPFGTDVSHSQSSCYTEQLRSSELEKFLSTDLDLNVTFRFVFDKREMTQVSAVFNMLLTIFVCFVLGIAGLCFSQIANTMVLEPLERILKMMHAIRQNPMEAIFIGEEDSAEIGPEQEWETQDATFSGRIRDLRSKFFYQCFGKRDKMPLTPSGKHLMIASLGHMVTSSLLLGNSSHVSAEKEKKLPETLILEKTILKIGSLLVLGFGEAGAEIIGENLKESYCAGSNSQVAIVPGRKVEAAFGFCDIRNFTDVTEVLQDKVMIFVNQIAAIIHEVVDTFGGCPNKNIGDAFLLVWRFPTPEDQRTSMANMALVCLVQIVSKIQSSRILTQYRSHAGLLERLPNYQVRLGFGMHFGWAIEGAIGSAYKIDASYLSENVTMASRLESATKAYDVILLVSESLVNHISVELHAELRLIDHIYFRGTRGPQKLYTMDMDPTAIYSQAVDEFEAAALSASVKRRKSCAPIQRRRRRRFKLSFDAYALFISDTDLQSLRARYNTSNKAAASFLHRFHAAFLNYEAGEWGIAQQILKEVRCMLEYDDGPSRSMCAYISQFNNEAPANWPGYRFL